MDIVMGLLEAFDIVYVHSDRSWYGRTNFGTKTVEVNRTTVITEALRRFTLAHEAGHIALRAMGKAAGGFEEEVAATKLAIQWGCPPPPSSA